MLDFVANHYAHTLLDEHIRFVDDFRALSRKAQCLYVRLINRKGRVFGRNRLRYPELGDPAPLLDELKRAEWVAGPAADDFDVVLTFLTRAEIYAVALPLVPGMSRSLKKAQLVGFVRDNIESQQFMAVLDTDRILVQLRADAVRYLLYLYFGRIRDSLTQFTKRDLGLVRTQDLQDS